MAIAVTFDDINQPAAGGPVYITFKAISTSGSTEYAHLSTVTVDIYGDGSRTVVATPAVSDPRHDSPVYVPFTPSGTLTTWVWGTTTDITETLYSGLCRARMSFLTAPETSETFLSGTFTLDMRQAGTLTITRLVGYPGDTLRLLYKTTKDGTGTGSGSPPPSIVHIYDANGAEQLPGSPPSEPMVEDKPGAWYYDLTISGVAAPGTWSYVVDDSGTETTFHFTVRRHETATAFRPDECVVSGYIGDLAGAPMASKSVKVVIDGPYYLAKNLQYPDFAPVITQTDINGYVALHLPRQARVIISIEDFKTAPVTVPDAPISPIADLL